MAKILVVEDDAALAYSLSSWLELEGHRPEVVHDGLEGLQLLTSYGFELAILDWQLPGLDGVEICSRYRRAGGRVPILMLTQKSQNIEKAAGLDAGADDYLTKPFDTTELSARVRALLRRGSGLFNSKKDLGPISLERGGSTVSLYGQTVKLLPKEFDVLEFLLRHPDTYFTVDQLLDNVWGSDTEASLVAVRTCISRLRAKLEFPGRPELIKTSRGWGYKISEDFLSGADASQP